MTQHPVHKILALWPSRAAVLHDAQAGSADLQMIAVHRWFQRASVPSQHWRTLVSGATARDISVTIDDFAAAHSASFSEVAPLSEAS